MVRDRRLRRRDQARPMAAPRGSRPDRWQSLTGPLVALGAILAVLWIAGLAGREAGLPTPSPSPSSGPLTIRFGTGLDPASGEARDSVDRFRAGDPFAYSVRLPAPASADAVWVEIIRQVGGQEEVAQPPSRQGIVTGGAIIAFEVSATDLLGAWGPGNYLMRMGWSESGPPFASGAFTLVETPFPS